MSKPPALILRVAICLWFPLFIVGMLLSMIVWPLVWVITGKSSFEWFFENLEPFELAMKWGLTKDDGRW